MCVILHVLPLELIFTDWATERRGTGEEEEEEKEELVEEEEGFPCSKNFFLQCQDRGGGGRNIPLILQSRGSFLQLLQRRFPSFLLHLNMKCTANGDANFAAEDELLFPGKGLKSTAESSTDRWRRFGLE